MALDYRKKQIKKISVPGWKEDPLLFSGSRYRFERRYTKSVKGDDISHISVSPSEISKDVTVSLSGRIFSIPTKTFKTDTQANAYAKRVMLHINKQIKEFGI